MSDKQPDIGPKSALIFSKRKMNPKSLANLLPPFNAATRPKYTPTLDKVAERIAKRVPAGSCACGCRNAVNSEVALVVPLIGLACDELHARIALAKLTNAARAKLRK